MANSLHQESIFEQNQVLCNGSNICSGGAGSNLFALYGSLLPILKEACKNITAMMSCLTVPHQNHMK